MSRLYAVDPAITVTGATADHRLAVPASRVKAFLLALGKKLGESDAVNLGPMAPAVQSGSEAGFDGKFLSALATDLVGAPERALIVVGSRQPPEVHALAIMLNAALRSLGRTLMIQPSADAEEPDHISSVGELVQSMKDGNVRTLVMLDQNPAYDFPSDLDFEGALSSVESSFQLSERRDETTPLVNWHCNLAHPFETWGDHRASDGTVLLQQPLIAPIWGGKSAIELVGLAAGNRNWRAYGQLRQAARTMLNGDFETAWRAALHSGVAVVGGSRPVNPGDIAAGVARLLPLLDGDQAAPLSRGNLEIAFAPCPKLGAGRQGNNLWLLELPDPITKISWDNAALMSPATAAELVVENGSLIQINRGGASLNEIAVWAVPGHADHCITLPLGWGRSAVGRYGNATDEERGGGFDVNPLRTTDGFWFGAGAEASKGGSYMLARTQEHADMIERPIVLSQPFVPIERPGDHPKSFEEQPDYASYEAVDMTTGSGVLPNGRPSPGAPLWEAVDYSEGYKWGMAIDLSACTGCSTCIVACQAENNIPNVGKRQIARGREMYWLRLDRYWSGTESKAVADVQPIGCQHCEEAPCENVCPVNATAHSPEGLNDMAYNRCIGTRYCANNCPYKVRRFNYRSWHGYVDDQHADYEEFPEIRKAVFNPNVTVRMRGVMEKCSYCVQRIQEAKIAIRRERRELQDGDVVSACQQVCPTGAIYFGNLNDPTSQVSEAVARQNKYSLLAELGIRPRTTFLSRVRNLNPEISNVEEDEAPTDGDEEGGHP